MRSQRGGIPIPPIQIPTVSCEVKGMAPRVLPLGQGEPALCSLSNQKGCPAYERKGRIGTKSRYGTAYETCCGEAAPCQHVTKVVTFSRRTGTADDFMREMAMQAEAAAIGVAPALRNVHVTAVEGMAVMERMPLDAFGYILKLVEDETTDGAAAGERLADEIGRTMMTLHAYGIRHRDTHAHNVMFDAAGRCKLIDFGQATRLEVAALVVGRAAEDRETVEAAYDREYLVLTDWDNLFMDLSDAIEQLSDQKAFARFDALSAAFEPRLAEWRERDISDMVARVKARRVKSL
jgi:hypothetical protein